MEGYGNENPGAFQSTRPLRGATSQPITKVELLGEFQPTRPLRGATAVDRSPANEVNISTHAPLAGRDLPLCMRRFRLSCISTHAPLAGRDLDGSVADCLTSIQFQPTRPLRGATGKDSNNTEQR